MNGYTFGFVVVKEENGRKLVWGEQEHSIDYFGERAEVFFSLSQAKAIAAENGGRVVWLRTEEDER